MATGSYPVTITQKVRSMSEYDQPAGPGPAASPTSPQPERAPGRVSVARTVITSRGAGWAVAAVLAGAVTALSILLAAGPSPARVVQIGAGPLGPARIQKIVAAPGGPGFRIVSGVGAGRRVITLAPGAQQIQVVPGPGAGQVFFPGPGVPPVTIHAQLKSPFGQVVAGTVGSVSGSTFTVTGPPGGQTFTVHEQSSTSYRKSGSPATASAVTKGAHVAVLGTLTGGTTMTATVVAVLP